RKDAPRGKILHLPLDNPELSAAETIIPESEAVILSNFWYSPNLLVTDDYLYVPYQTGGPSEVRVFDHSGRRQQSPQMPPVSSIGEIVSLKNNSVLYRVTSYIDPPAWYRFNPANGKSAKTALYKKSPVEFNDVEVVREFATSKDGTRIPINIIRRKGIKMNGSNPTLLYGYGGYGISVSPGFDPLMRIWLDQGGVYAEANIRGGGEFGEEWHRQGMLTRKQNVFDDFAAAMQHLIESGYTRPEKLAILGGSNGGLLMGAMITQHPQLFEAAVSYVGFYDALRTELSPNGAFNIPEFGTVKNAEQFKALYTYSPYHHVQENTGYPAVLFMTGANDPRVDPMHSRKMTARLQQATTSGEPVLLRTSSSSGHGSGTPLSEKIAQKVDQYVFLFNELGMKYQPAGDKKMSEN
ncbi:MAG: prolyl oligopeptidase family serine peptidase, partial [Calditrichia bacterium]